MTATRVRVRGIYATALTAALREAGHEVVQASGPIRERFDAAFADGPGDVRVTATDDRQGVAVTGPAGDVEAVVAAVRRGRDALAWRDRAATDAVFDATVARTGSGGAVLDLGEGDEAYLPFSETEAHVTEGDRIRVQVTDPAPPWAGDRPVVGTDLRVAGGLATLDRGVEATVAGTPRGADDLAGLTEVLSTTVPEDWGVRWEAGAEDASMEDLDAALAAVVDRARALEDALDDDATPGPPARVAAPVVTTWTWFGRETRFALDDLRRAVAPTMAGHHRVKAGAASAGEAVDLVERLGDPPDSFPFDAVTDTFGPTAGETVRIEHGKPDGRLVTLGRGEVTDRDPAAETVTVRREMGGTGTYDGLGVPQEDGDVAVTKFREGRWWYPTTYRDADGAVKGTYVNVCTPVEVFPDAVRYVDLHVDVLRHADGAVEVVDEDDLATAEEEGLVPPDLATQARDVAARVERGLS